MSDHIIGQSPDQTLDNLQYPQAATGDHRHPNEGEPPKMATATPQRALWSNIPAELRERPQWCVAAPDKRPLTVNGQAASSTDPSTWADFDSVCQAAAASGLHIGYVLSSSDPFTCIDMDIKPDSLPAFTQHCNDMVDAFDSYTEHSKSGLGYHIWVEGDIPAAAKSGGVEVYADKRFMVCTGNVVNNKPIAERDHLVKQYAQRVGGKKTEFVELPDAPATDTDDSILQRAFAAANSDKIIAHYNGDWTAIGHTDHSKADEALLQMLAHYTPNNEQLIRLFLDSRLGQRDKAKRPDYLPRTISYVRSMQAADLSRNNQRVEHGETMAIALLENYERTQEKLKAQNKAQAMRGITTYTAAEAVNRPPLKWRVKGVLPERGIAAVYGPYSSGKSFLTLDMLAHIGTGQNWFGHTVRRSPVAYVAFEGEGGVPARIQAFQKKYWAIENVTFMEAPTINLLEPAGRDALVETLKDHLVTGGVVCIDTLAASSPGMDENSSEGMGKLISELKVVQHEVGGCILVVHHTGKDKDKGMRGWSGLGGALDAAIEVVVTKSGARSWKLAKIKDGKDGLVVPFDLEAIFLNFDEDGEPETSCVVVAATEQNDFNHAESVAEDAEFIWEWIRKEVEAGKFPSGRSLEVQMNEMKPQRKFTQIRVREAIIRLKAEGRLQTEKKSGGSWFRAVDATGGR